MFLLQILINVVVTDIAILFDNIMISLYYENILFFVRILLFDLEKALFLILFLFVLFLYLIEEREVFKTKKKRK